MNISVMVTLGPDCEKFKLFAGIVGLPLFTPLLSVVFQAKIWYA